MDGTEWLFYLAYGVVAVVLAGCAHIARIVLANRAGRPQPPIDNPWNLAVGLVALLLFIAAYLSL